MVGSGQGTRRFDDRIEELCSNLIDSDKLDSIRDTFTTINNLRTDFAGHQGEFLPFLSQYLIGTDSNIFSALLGTLCIDGPPVAGTDFGAAARTHAQRGQVGQWQYRLRFCVGVARATKREGRGRVSTERPGEA